MQLFKRIEPFVLKVQITSGIDMTVWIGILTPYQHQKTGT